MRKLILSLLLSLAAFSLNAQTITCRDSIYDNGYYKVINVCDTIPYTGTCYDTSLVSYDSCYSKQRWWGGYRTKCVPRTKQVIEPYACNKTKIECHDVLIWVSDPDTLRICDTIILPPNVTTQWGIKVVGLSVADNITIAKKMGITCLRTAVEIENYSGQNIKFIDDCYEAGIKLIVNINWQSAGIQRRFPTDMVKYRIQLRKFLDKYADKIEVGVCENEPSVDKFYVSDKVAYINELRAFVEVMNEYVVQCTDGAIFIEVVAAMADGKVLTGYNGWDEVVYFVNAYKTIPLTYVNFHTVGEGNSYPAGQFKKAADYIKQVTGHESMSNEVHTEDGSPELIYDIVGQAEDANFHYFLFWGGGTGGDPFNQGTNLTELGFAYANAIKEYSVINYKNGYYFVALKK